MSTSSMSPAKRLFMVVGLFALLLCAQAMVMVTTSRRAEAALELVREEIETVAPESDSIHLLREQEEIIRRTVLLLMVTTVVGLATGLALAALVTRRVEESTVGATAAVKERKAGAAKVARPSDIIPLENGAATAPSAAPGDSGASSSPQDHDHA